MTEEITIDVSNCPHKSDDDCIEVPICNEYGDLMGYQSCEAQTLCPYRSQKKIERLEQEIKELRKANEISIEKVTVTAEAKRLQELEQENKELKEMLSKEPKAMQAFQISYSGLKRDNETLWGMVKDYKTALEEIREIVTNAFAKQRPYKEDFTEIETIINKVLNS